MAAKDEGYTTGARKDEAELQRRNVSSYENANGSTVYKVEAEDIKKLQKKVRPNQPRVEFNLLTATQTQKSPGLLQILDDYEFLIAPLVFTAFALFTRLWRIGLSNIVTWDEAQ